MIRRLGNTPLVPLLGGGPAVLLQVAHPLVAAGVIDHSEVGRDLWRRLVQTLRALYLIAFGTKWEAERAAEVAEERCLVSMALDIPVHVAVAARGQGNHLTSLGEGSKP